MRFRSGELDLVNNLDPQLFDRVKSQAPRGARDLGVALDTEQLWFNQVANSPIPAHKKEWFRSREFRLAISEAINRTDIARIVYRGYATPAVGPVSPANHLWLNPSIRVPRTNQAAALERLSRAGFRMQNGTLFDKAGNPVEFSVITNAGNRSREQMATLIQADLKKIGIRVSPAPIDFPSLIGRITKTYDYDACLLGLVMTDLDPISQTSIWMSSGPQHQWNPGQSEPATQWEAEIDSLMRKLASAGTFPDRKAAFDRVQEIVVDAAPFIYLVNRHALVAVSSKVRGCDPVVLRPQTLWNVERLWLASAP
jgi:peptide/nickel transport system substrate-binding protein